MHWLFYNHSPKYPIERKIWIKIRFIYETEKAILVLHEGAKVWIPKSRINKIKLRKGAFWIYVKKSTVE